MRVRSCVRSWLRAMQRRSRMESEMDAELRFHLEGYAEDLVRRGVPREEAMRRARIEFGGVERAKEECRDARGTNFIESLVQDLRFGQRMLCKTPGFTTVAVLTLALGIGANTAIFTLIDAVMLKSLPVASPKQLYRLGDNNNCCVMVGTQNGGSFVLYSYPLYEDVRDETPEFSELAAFASSLSDLSIRRGGSAA